MSQVAKRKMNSTDAENASNMPNMKNRKLNESARYRERYSALEKLPTELMIMILNELTPHEHLSLKLTSKMVARYLKNSDGSNYFDLSALTKDELSACHIRLERDLPRGLHPHAMFCTLCGKYHDRSHFIDQESRKIFSTLGRKSRKSRVCITGGIVTKAFGYQLGTDHGLTIMGLPHFMCAFCVTFCPAQSLASGVARQRYLDIAAPWCSSEKQPALCKKCLPGRLKSAESLVHPDLRRFWNGKLFSLRTAEPLRNLGSGSRIVFITSP